MRRVREVGLLSTGTDEGRGRDRPGSDPQTAEAPRRYCIHCGMVLDSGAKTCGRCGRSQPAMPDDVVPRSSGRTAVQAGARRNLTVVLAAATAALIVAVVVLLVAVGRGDDSDDVAVPGSSVPQSNEAETSGTIPGALLPTERFTGEPSQLNANDPNVVDPAVTYSEWLGRIEVVYGMIDDLRAATASDNESLVDPETGPPPTACAQLDQRSAAAVLLPAPDAELATYADAVSYFLHGAWILCGGGDSAADGFLDDANGLAAEASGIAQGRAGNGGAG